MFSLGTIIGSILIGLAFCYCEHKGTCCVCCLMCIFIAWWMVWINKDSK